MNMKHEALSLDDFRVLTATLRRRAAEENGEQCERIGREVMSLIHLVEPAIPKNAVTTGAIDVARSLVVLGRNRAALDRLNHLLLNRWVASHGSGAMRRY
jgi:hypothetical protein